MEQLIRLQNIDTKLKDLNDLLGDLPSKVEDLNRQEESVKSSIVDKKTRSKELSGIFFNSFKQSPLMISLRNLNIYRFNLKLNLRSIIFT